MGQVTETTIKMIEEHAARGEHAPLTVWELQQLAHAWRKANSLQLADVARTMPADVLSLPSGATSIGTYRNVDDGATYTWGMCDDGYFRLDQFGWATWPTQEDFSRALMMAAAPQAPAATVPMTWPVARDVLQRWAQFADQALRMQPRDMRNNMETLAEELTKLSALAPAAAPAAPAVDARDTARMNWLEAQVVNVRAPLRYGSRDLFWASPEEVDGGPDGPSDLRARIDAAQAAAKGEHDHG